MSTDSPISPSASRLTRSQRRKDDHIELCYSGDVSLEGDRGLWSDVHLEHDALPELRMSDVSLETEMIGHTFAAPLMLTGMTGGTERAALINRGLARVCQALNIPFGLGSQRIMTYSADQVGSQAELDQVRATFMVKEYAPEVFLVANIGVNQLRDLGVERVVALCAEVGADALAVHLNPAMELVQPGRDADSDFTGGLAAIQSICQALDHVIVKECGCGISAQVARRLSEIGVKNVDVSGVGGTSWVKLEAIRAQNERDYSREARLGMLLADWGIPTAAATWHAAQTSMRVVASGGVSDALQATKALALGADMVGLARPALRAFLTGYERGGEEAAYIDARAFLDEMIYGVKVITALTGRRSPDQLRHAPRVIGPRLGAWIKSD